MDEFLNRLQLIIDKLFKGNQAAFARAIRIKPTTLSNYFSDKKATKPSMELALSIAESLGVDGNWLLTGVGNMGVQEPLKGDDIDTHAPNSPAKIVGNVNYHNSDKVEEVDEEKVDVEIHCPDDLRKIEVLTVKVDSLTTENRKQEDTIADLRETIKDLRERIKELKAQKK